jgi:hypothetical protein
MAYTTVTLVRREAGFQNNVNISDSLDLEGKVEGVEGIIDGYVGQAYPLPLSSLPTYTGSSAESTLSMIATSYSAGEAMMQLFIGQGAESEAYITGMKKRDMALATLKSIAKGDMRLFGTDNKELGKNEGAKSMVSIYPKTPTRLFSKDTRF